jgi:hypothetical protein
MRATRPAHLILFHLIALEKTAHYGTMRLAGRHHFSFVSNFWSKYGSITVKTFTFFWYSTRSETNPA